MNTPVSFELAKLLKEKGFREEVRDYYEEKDGTFYYSQYFRDNVSINEKHKGFVTAPTIAEVVMWLCEKHLLWVYAHKDGGWWFPVIENYYDEDEQGTIIESLERIPKIQFNSPTEAYEAAIEYTLTNLI